MGLKIENFTPQMKLAIVNEPVPDRQPRRKNGESFIRLKIKEKIYND